MDNISYQDGLDLLEKVNDTFLEVADFCDKLIWAMKGYELGENILTPEEKALVDEEHARAMVDI